MRRNTHGDARVEQLAWLLDDLFRIPGTRIRFGLDPILGLLPGAGDTVSAALSVYIIVTAVRSGLPKGVVARMVFNVAVDLVLGSVPLLGNLFDFAWKANDKNLRLLNRYARSTGSSLWSDWAWAVFLLAGLLAMMVLLGAALFYVWRAAQSSWI